MRAGDLKYRIELLKPTESKGSLGNVKQEYSSFVDDLIPVAIRSIKQTENYVSEQIKTKSELKFVMRYLPGVDTSMRVKFEGKTYEILDVLNPIYARKELQLYAKVVL